MAGNRNKYTKRFIDALRLHIKSGRGGNGSPKFGGVGGKGGDIYIKGKKELTLEMTRQFKKGHYWKAGDGEPSRQFHLFGEPGKDLIIPSPLGTIIETSNNKKYGEILQEDDTVLVARGGCGGNCDNLFAGQHGEDLFTTLMLKLIADVGLVGFPNAGKSTLLRALSTARPKVASYPFTTLHPIVGSITYEDLRQVSVADLPGLIEGAWINYGMGHKFLRHLERTKLLLFVVDIDGFQFGPMYARRSAIDTVILLNKELELYQSELVEKPAVLLVNKMDKPGSQKKFDFLQKQILNIEDIFKTMPQELKPEKLIKFQEILCCSAKYNPSSVELVKDRLRENIDLCYDDEVHSFLKIHNKIKSHLYEKNANIK